MMSGHSKKICLSILAIVGSSLLISCNKNSDSNTPNNNEKSSNENNLPELITPEVKPEQTEVVEVKPAEETETAAESESDVEDGIKFVDFSDLKEGGFPLVDFSSLTPIEEEGTLNEEAHPDIVSETPVSSLSFLETLHDIKITLEPVCAQNILFKNAAHNIPVKVTVTHKDSNIDREFTSDEFQTIKRNLKFYNYISSSSSPEITDVALHSDEYSKCFKELSKDLSSPNYVFIPARSIEAYYVRLFASLNYSERQAVITSIPAKGKKGDLLKIDLFENPFEGRAIFKNNNVFVHASSLLKATSADGLEKTKVIKIEGNNKLSAHYPLTLDRVSLNNHGEKESLTVFSRSFGSFSKVNEGEFSKIGTNRKLRDINFLDFGTTQTQLTANDHFDDIRDEEIEAKGKKSDITDFASTDFGFIVNMNLDDKKQKSSKIDLNTTGYDVFGNRFETVIKEEKW